LSSTTKILASAAALIAIIGIIVLISNKVQQSDPTLTKAPPVSANAVPLQPSAAKAQHPGPMYIMTPNGAVENPNHSGAAPGGP